MSQRICKEIFYRLLRYIKTIRKVYINVCYIWFCFQVTADLIFNELYQLTFIRDVRNDLPASKYKSAHTSYQWLSHSFPHVQMFTENFVGNFVQFFHVNTIAVHLTKELLLRYKIRYNSKTKLNRTYIYMNFFLLFRCAQITPKI